MRGRRFPLRCGLSRWVVGLALAVTFAAPAHASGVTRAHVEAELVAENLALGPGENWVALRLKPEPGWHTYFREPGETGLPTSLSWDLPAGVIAGEIQWPHPLRFEADGIVSYGYESETLHLVSIRVPGAAVGSDIVLSAEARWLACASQCIPGRASLSLEMPVRAASGPPGPWAAAFQATRERLAPPMTPPAGSPDGVSAASPDTAPLGLGLALALAVLGGLILNLMPCVFPVLSIKAVSVIEAHGKGGHQQKVHALAYTSGVLVSTLAAGLTLVALRAAGQGLGWGFQLQSPVFVAAIIYLLFALGLSMSGLVQFGTSVMGVGQSLAMRGGYAGSFFTGVLAVVVASPCTAPFMGTAMGYALAQPSALALLVFAALGLGLALPFLAIGFVPALARLLPRPGAWMETFKQAMAYPLYLTVVWLVWVLARQAGVNAVPVILAGLVLIALACWLLARPGIASRAVRYAATAAAVGLLFMPTLQPRADAAPAADSAWEPYSDARLAELRAEGRAVFVNLTADWCITCKLNERMALDADGVQAALARRQVVTLRGDWTRSDPAITRVLNRFDRPGVPLYLLYAPGADPVVLPQLLSEGMVVSAIEALPSAPKGPSS